MSSHGKTHNRPINHIALSCTDLDGLVSWYTEVLGFELLGVVHHFKRSVDPTPFETIFVSYPPTLKELKFAILTSGNGVGIECFEFLDSKPKPRVPEEGYEFSLGPGVFHICITEPNPKELVQRVLAAGGKTVGD